ncbi:MAG: MFS transporter [Arenimonas sp.]|nr:MFS transporter [Arenimonas sp.]
MSPATTRPGRIHQLRGALRELPHLGWAFLYFFCLLTGYYVLRPVRDAMAASANVEDIFSPVLVAWFAGHGVDLHAYTLQVLFSATFVAMLALQPVYGALVSRYPRRVFLPVVYLVFIACLVGFYFAFQGELAGRGALFFVWTAVFNLFAVSVFWSYMGDIFDNAQAKQLYGFIGAGGTLGGLAGPTLTKLLVVQVGVANMMLVSVGFLAVCLLCIARLAPWARAADLRRGGRSGDEAMGGRVLEGLRLIWRDPLLRAMAALMFFGVGIGTLLYNEQREIAMRVSEDSFRTAFYSNIDWWINVLVLVVQVFVTRPLLTRFGVAPALLIPAFAILGGFAVLSASPLPLLVAMVQIATRASEFALSKPARETIYTRVDRESRYKAKAAIETAVYRGGDVSFAWIHKGLALFGSQVVFGAGVLVAAGMTYGAWRLIREQAKLPPDPT